MATAPTQIRIDSDVKKQANDLFSHLGFDMSSAVNIFLHQCILRGGLPFSVEMPQFNQKHWMPWKKLNTFLKTPTLKGTRPWMN